MSEQKMHDALKRTVRHVVETMCFSAVAPIEQAWEKADTVLTAVNFYGSRSGRLQLEVSSSVACSLRDAFLGTAGQEPVADSSAGDLVGELGAMICGRFLSALDPLAPISLGTPQNGSAGDLAAEGVRQGFVLASGYLTASVEFDQDQLV